MIRCAACNHENRPGAKFCEECATPLKRVCAGCGSELRPNAKFCDECGAATGAAGGRSEPRASRDQREGPAEGAGARKVVTVVFADLIGSTALHERLDAESARLFMESYYRAMRGAIEAHGGTVAKLLGDGVLAVFGAPRVAEDDAPRAVRAGVEMQRAFRTLADQHGSLVGAIGLRVAVNTGEVVASDAAEIIGDPVNVAARLQEQARDGDVVIGEATHRLVSMRITLAPLGSFSLKGRTEAVKAYRVVTLEPPAGVAMTAFVGREDELARIARVYEAAIATPAARLAVLLGSPGLGKSRIIDEFARRQADTATVISAHCDATGGATFAPIAEAIRALLHIDDGASGEALRAAIDTGTPITDADRTRIVDGITALLAGSPASPEETFFVVRRFLAALAAVRPVILVVDDFQWAEPLLLDLVEHLVQWGSGVPLLVLVGARPELRDARSSLATPGGLVADVVTLGGLDAGAAMRLAANVIGAADLPAAVAAKVLAASEGNPLFVGELVRMMVEEGALERHGDRWTVGAGLAELEMPPTIHALLAARIERLRPEERIVLERAAVVGRHFARSAVAELLPRDVTDLDARLESLRRSELIERDTGWFLGEPVLRFHHMLIRDAAYRRVLKGTRADLHARLAGWIEVRAGDSIENDETIGWHLEQAHQHLAELGPIDEKGRVLGERAARYLAAAGRRALARDDLPLAASLLGRALDRLDASDPQRADLALEWCEALLAAGDVGPAAAAIDELGRFTADSDRLRAWHTCFAGQLTVFTAPQALHATTDAVATAAETLTRLGDAAGEAKAHFVHAQALARLGKVGACEAALDRALAAARRAGDRRRANAVLAGAPLAALWGPSPVTRASGRCLDVVRVLRITQGAPAVEAVALSCQGVLEALRGRTDAARRMIASSRKMVEELGITHRLLEADVFGGQIDLIEGDAVAAERSLRGAYEGLRELGLGIDAAQAAALLARALLAQERAAEAETLSHESEALAGDDLKAAIAWRGVRAEALARRGEHVAAVELAEAAVAIASATDALLDHADARLALAAALRAAGRSAEADAQESRATELWEAKGATLLADRARHGVARVEAPTDVHEAARIAFAGAGRRRVRPNAATADAARVDAAVAARDPNALRELFAEDLQVDDHTTGIVFDRQGALASFGYLITARNPTCRNEPIATLGEGLAIYRFSVSASGLGRGKLDVGAYEKEEIHLNEVDAEGRRRWGEVFAIDHLNEAIVRLYERYAKQLPEGPSKERVVEISRTVGKMYHGLVNRKQLANPFAAEVEMVDHRRVGLGTVHGAEAVLDAVRAFVELVQDAAWRTDDVLALTENATLQRATNFGTDRVSGGSFERVILSLQLYDDEGRVCRWETFESEAEAEALARFDELTAEPSTARPSRRRVCPNLATVATARFAAAFSSRDDAALEVLFGEPLAVIDHPNGAAYGRDGHLDSLRRLQRATNPKLAFESLATLGESLALSRRRITASGSRGGRFDVAEWQREEILLSEADERAQIQRLEIFAGDRLRDAVVRLYERHAELSPDGAARIRAAATAHAAAALLGSLGDQGGERFESALAPDIEFTEHGIVTLPSLRGADEVKRAFLAICDVTNDIDNRTDDILGLEANVWLLRATLSGTGRASGGLFERSILSLLVFGPDGRAVRYEVFDGDRVDAALSRFDDLTGRAADVERDARYEAGEATVHERASAFFRRYREGIAARDWGALAALCAPGLVAEDHRLVSWGTLRGPVAWADAVRKLLELAPDTGLRVDHARTSARAVLFQGAWVGTRDGGQFEIPVTAAIELDEVGRQLRLDVYDDTHVDDALMRFEEIGASVTTPEPRFANAASRTIDRLTSRFYARDWADLEAGVDPSARVHDRRRMMHLESSAAEFLAGHRLLFDVPGVRWEMALLATRGERLSLHHVRFSGNVPDGGGRFEADAHLCLAELGADSRIVAVVLFDLDDREAAYIELDARYEAGEGAAYGGVSARYRAGVDAINRREWSTFAELYAPGFEQRDHRVLGWGNTLSDVETWVRAQQALVELSPDARYRVDHVRVSDRVLLSQTAQVGTREGGAFENPMLLVGEWDEADRVMRFDSYDLAQADEAYARFEELCSCKACYSENPVTKSNRAHEAMNRWQIRFGTAIETGDWEPLRRLCASEFAFEDRRRLALLTGDVELMIASARERVAIGARAERRLIGTAGDRICISRMLWSGGPAGGRFEIEYLGVTEVDEAGQFAAILLFDVDDARAAKREMWARWAVIDPVAAPWVELLTGLADAWNAHARAGVRAQFADDFVVEDHRRTGLGRIEGADAYMDSMTVLWDLAPDQRIEFGWSWPALDRHAAVATLRREGTLADGGAFENDYLWLGVAEHGRLTRLELFEPEDLEAALARFEELRPTPST